MSLLRATLDLGGSLFALDYRETSDALDRLLSSLGPQVDPAAEKLASALSEIDRMLSALDAQLVRFLVLDFTDGPIPREDMRTLVELSAGQAAVRIEEARGHCSRIELIYEVHLKRWLSEVIAPEHSRALERMFHAMHDADLGLIAASEKVNVFLSENAEDVLERVSAGNLIAANDLIFDARRQSLPTRRLMFREMAVLRRYESAFVRASKAI